MTNTRYMSHVHYIKHVQIKSLIFFVKIIVRRFASHIFNTFNNKWRQVKPKRRPKNDQTWIFFKIALFGHVLKKISTFTFWSTFGLQLVRGPRLSKFIFLEVKPWTQTIDKGHLPWSDFMVHSVNRPLECMWIACLQILFRNCHKT